MCCKLSLTIYVLVHRNHVAFVQVLVHPIVEDAERATLHPKTLVKILVYTKAEAPAAPIPRTHMAAQKLKKRLPAPYRH